MDFRLQTFLTLCETGSYTKTAEQLHITQPAVSQHIKFLEKEYGAKLFVYAARRLQLTEKGKQLRVYTVSLRSNSRRIEELMRRGEAAGTRLEFGATLTVGEYVMPPVLEKYLKENPDGSFCMKVENTDSLLRKLEQGEIRFALIEGNFDRRKYDSRLFSQEPFVAVCAGKHPLAAGVHELREILGERLITREPGSGTRNVLETVLYEHNLSMEDFPKEVEVGNTNAMKQLAAEGLGVAFLYREAARNELESGMLRQVRFRDLTVWREFNFVFLRGDIFQEESLRFFDFCREHSQSMGIGRG